jgi:hypothetical protein
MGTCQFKNKINDNTNASKVDGLDTCQFKNKINDNTNASKVDGLDTCQFKEIIVPENIATTNKKVYKEIIVIEDFLVENGLLGLDRDVYLSLVKFLDSSVVRKV